MWAIGKGEQGTLVLSEQRNDSSYNLRCPAIWGKDSTAVYAGLQGEWSPEVF